MDAGSLLRQRRLANGLSQAQLALGAGSTQAAVSRIERGEVAPTTSTLARLLAVMGEELALAARRMPGDFDRAHLRELRRRTPAERLELALGWNRLAGEIGAAGERARRMQ